MPERRTPPGRGCQDVEEEEEPSPLYVYTHKTARKRLSLGPGLGFARTLFVSIPRYTALLVRYPPSPCCTPSGAVPGWLSHCIMCVFMRR